jgi:hypothetical protein
LAACTASGERAKIVAKTAATMRHRVGRVKLKTLWEANPGTPNKRGLLALLGTKRGSDAASPWSRDIAR